MTDPVAVASQFLPHFTTLAAQGNVAGMQALYGEDSIASYDGNLAQGAQAISNAFVAPRLAGGLQIRFSGFSAQLTATNHIIISADGESNKPQGRFTQVFLLGTTAAGGMYIKVDFCRFGAGSVAQQLASDATGMTMPFLSSYYTEYGKAPRVGIMPLYHPAKSQLSMGDSQKAPPAVGQAAIGVLHLGAPPKTPTDEATPARMPSGVHEMATVDATCVIPPGGAPINGIAPAVLVFVTGQITLAGEANKLSFSHVFILATEAGNTFIANELCNLIYG